MNTAKIMIVCLLFAGCERCYNFTIRQTTTPKLYGQPETVITRVEKCGMTSRDAKNFKQATEGTTKITVSGTTYTTTTTVTY
jgi:hypothetical protein